MDALITTRALNRNRNVAGFTLIELMIAMVLGLIVIGAVLALSLSMIRSNSDTIASTRLTQELRATASAITSELQRAGSVADPFDLTAATSIGPVDDSTDGCLQYSYSFLNASSEVKLVNRAISKNGEAIFVGPTCGAGETQLSSNTVDISVLRFKTEGRAISVTLRGELKLSKGDVVYREYSQTVFAPGLVAGT